MKKIISLSLVLVLLALCLVSCSTIGGKYSQYPPGTAEPTVTLHFTRGGKIHVYAGEYGLFKDPIDTIYYKIDGDTIYTWNDHTKEEYSKGTDFEKGKDETGSYIKIGKVLYYKN